MGDVGPLENHGFRSKLVKIRSVYLHASVTSERIRSLLVRQKKNVVIVIDACYCGQLGVTAQP